MKRTTYLSIACLLGGLLAATIMNGLHGPARAAQVTAPTANPLDVVINEVAWMGTPHNDWDEWIELYNNTPNTITLDGWRITFIDNTPNTITLSGNIGPYGYFLLERVEDVISDIESDQVYGGVRMSNSSESMQLLDNLDSIIDTVNQDGGDWPAGTNTPDHSMERIDPTASDTDANWDTNDGITRNGQDADSNPINGTPRAQNSCHQALAADLHVTKTGPATASAGDPITYYLTLGNSGDVTATATRVTDTLPAAVEFIAQDSAFAFSQPGGALVWEVGSVPSGTLHAITITGRVSDTATGDLSNHVTATTSATETLTANNADSWVTTVIAPGQTDLFVAKTGPELAAPGSPITYYITIGNAGSIAADAARLTDTLPATVAFVGQDSSFAFTPTGRSLLWSLGDVPTGTQHTITVTGQVAASALFTLTNRVTATTSASETVTANNTGSWDTLIGEEQEARVLISGVLYDGYQSGDADEAIQLINAGSAAANLDGWEVCKDTGSSLSCRPLPAAVISPTARVWLARETAAFSTSFGFLPDHELDNWLSSGLSNSGDEVILRDDLGHVADALVYEEGKTDVLGWDNASGTVEPYGVGRAEGQILYRIPDEATGLPTSDTDTAADWIQHTGNVTYGRRVLYPGWDLDPLFWPLTATETATVVVGITPDNGFDVLSQTIARAQHTISVEVYALRHPGVITALVQKARADVDVTVLLEGGQAGVGVDDLRWQQELWACQQIEQAGGACWFMIHETGDDVFNRYNFAHTKFVIVDGEWLVISSQNFSNSSMPSDDKSNGTYGSRGVVLATNAPAIVARAAEVFGRDLDPAHHNDVLRWNTNPSYIAKYGPPDPAFEPTLVCADHTTYTVQFPGPLAVNGEFGFELFTAPEAALRRSDALLGLVSRAGAGDVVYVEQLYEHVDWGDDPGGDPNLRLEAYITAARRGASVRILLNSGTFGQDYYDNTNVETVAYVRQIARAEGLNLKAAIGDPTEYGIHNKMVLVWLDGEGGYAHVGSINGSESSSKVNREMALQVRSDEVYNYLARVFEFDWWASNPVFLPLVMRNHAPPDPPVEYVVISEVMYRPSGQSSGKREWVELYNPTAQAIDLSGWQLGDTAATEYGAGRYTFPAGTVLQAGGVIVVAQQAEDFEGVAGFTTPDYEFLIDPHRDDPGVPNMTPVGAWDGFGLGLGDAGDKVILRTPAGADVDALVYGTATYPGTVAHAGGVDYNVSLERRPPYYDTDDCSVDFVPRDPPTPGSVPEE